MRLFKYVSLSVVVAAVALVAAGGYESWSQTPVRDPRSYGYAPPGYSGREAVSYWMASNDQVGLIRQAIEQLNKAETDEARTAATEQLSTRLTEYFDADMERREEELRPLEERVQKLRAQIDLRKSKKQEIIDLQLQLAENEAAGLGFFSEPQSRYSPSPALDLPPLAPDYQQPSGATRPARPRGIDPSTMSPQEFQQLLGGSSNRARNFPVPDSGGEED